MHILLIDLFGANASVLKTLSSSHLKFHGHYSGVIMSAMACQITSLTIVYSTVYSGGDKKKHQSSAWLPFVRGIHRSPVNSKHKGPVTRKMFPFDDVIMNWKNLMCSHEDDFVRSHEKTFYLILDQASNLHDKWDTEREESLRPKLDCCTLLHASPIVETRNCMPGIIMVFYLRDLCCSW